MVRFGKKGKLSPRFIGPYEILERVGHVAYRLTLPLELTKLHDVFHVSMLRRYRSDESHILLVQDLQVQSDFSYDEEPKSILAREKIVAEQVSAISESALATPWQGGSYLGTISNYEDTIPSTLQFR